MRILRAVLSGGILSFGLFAGSVAFADNNIEAVPTGWRLQDYGDGGVSAYYTGSTCPSGRITLPASALADTKNRFWTLVLSAKVTGKVVGIYYDPSTCNITSFYMKES